MDSLDALAQNEGVLYADCNDEGRPQEKTLEEDACHLSGPSYCRWGRWGNRRWVIRFPPCTIRFLPCTIHFLRCVICFQYCIIRSQP